MAEQREQCCGNCWWWMDYTSRDGGWCCRDGSDMLASEGCSQWEQDRRYSDDDQDEQEEDDGT